MASFMNTSSADALSQVTNPDGSTTNLVFDVHQYLDSEYLGESANCTYDGSDAASNLATWLRSVGRQAMLTETGGGSTDSCYTDLCSFISSVK